MIDTVELRIGNLIYEQVLGNISIVGTYGKIVYAKKDGNTYSLTDEYISPIELTEDILIKCGFEYVKNEEMSECLGGDMSLYKKNKIEIFLPEGSCNVLMNYEFENRVQYLHQLQNLFYCLTGKELEITL